MTEPVERAVADDLHDVAPAIQWVTRQLDDAGLSEDARYALEVCLEEALANLIFHGRAGDQGKDIAVAFTAGDGEATVVITDRCAPFDVTDAVPAQSADPLVLTEGGRGLGLLRAFATEVAYMTEGGRNALTLRFRAPPAATIASARPAG